MSPKRHLLGHATQKFGVGREFSVKAIHEDRALKTVLFKLL